MKKIGNFKKQKKEQKFRKIIVSLIMIWALVFSFPTFKAYAEDDGSWYEDTFIETVLDFVWGIFESGTEYGKGELLPPETYPAPIVSQSGSSINISCKEGWMGLEMERAIYSNGIYTKDAYWADPVMPFTDTENLVVGTSYAYRCSPEEAAWSEYSKEIVFTDANAVATPDPPSVSNTTAGQLNISWVKPVGDITHYKLYRSLAQTVSCDGGVASIFNFVQKAEAVTYYYCNFVQVGGDITGTSYIDTSVNEGSTYAYKLVAYNNTDSSAESGQSSGTTVAMIPSPPSTPTAPSLALGPNELNITWTQVADATGYKLIRYKLDPAGCGGTTSWISNFIPRAYAVEEYCEDKIMILGDVSSYADTTTNGLLNNQTYKYTLKALNEGGESAEGPSSGVVQFVLIPSVPSAPSVVLSNSKLNITWPLVAGATGYKLIRYIEQDTACDGGTVAVFDIFTKAYAAGYYCENKVMTLGSVSSYEDTTANGLVNTKYYKYTLKATNEGGESGESAVSNEKQFITAPPTPSAPSVNLGSNKLNITWPAVSGATGYKLIRYKEELSGCGTTSWLSKFFPKAYAASEYCEEKTMTLGSVTSYDDTTANGLVDNATYQYRLKAINIGGESIESSSSNSKQFVLLPPTPNAPSAVLGASKLSVTWPVVSGATGYKLIRYIEQDTACDGGTVAVFDIFTKAYAAGYYCENKVMTLGSVSSYDDTTANGLVNNKIYRYTLKALNVAGESTESPESGSAQLILPPAQPSSLSNTLGSNQINVSWSAVAGATDYRLKRYYCSNTEVCDYIFDKEILLGSVTTYTDTVEGLVDNRIYSYGLTAVNIGGQSAESNKSSLITFHINTLSRPVVTDTLIRDSNILVSIDEVDYATNYKITRYKKTLPEECEGSSQTSWLKKLIPSVLAVDFSTMVDCFDATYDTTETLFTDNQGLVLGSYYTYEVIATRGSVESSASLMTDPKKFGVVYPSKPDITIQRTDTQIEINWVAPNPDEEIDLYRITKKQWKTDAVSLDDEKSFIPKAYAEVTGSFVVVDEFVVSGEDLDSGTYVDDNIDPNGVYTYDVTAENVSGSETIGVEAIEPDGSNGGFKDPIITLKQEGDNVKVTWGAIDGATSYTVYRLVDPTCGESSFLWFIDKAYAIGECPEEESFSVSSGTEYTDGGPHNLNLDIQYRVVAHSEIGSSTAGDNAKTINLMDKPVISTVTQTVNVNTGVYFNNVTWGAIDGATSYELKRQRTSNCDNPIDGDAFLWPVQKAKADSACPIEDLGIVTSPSFANITTDVGETFSYWVIAYNGVSYSNDSTQFSYATIRGPQNVTARQLDDDDGNNIWRVTWDAVTGATEYKIYARYSDTTYSLFTTVSASSNNYIMGNVDNAGSRSVLFKIVAVMGDSQSVSSAASFEHIMPFTSTDPVVVQQSNNVKVTWDPIDGVSNYVVHRKYLDKLGYIYDDFDVASNTLTDEDIIKGVTYTYWVEALRTNSSRNSSEKSIATINSPGNFDYDETIDETGIEMSWATVANATGYKIYRYIGGTEDEDGNYTPDGNAIEISGGDTTTYLDLDDNLVNEYYYYYEIQSLNGISYSPEVTGRSVKYLKKPEKPASVTATQQGNQFRVEWTTVQYADSYKVEALDVVRDETAQLCDIANPPCIANISSIGNGYILRVTSKNGFIESDGFTESAELQTMVKPTISASVAGTTATITWGEVTGASTYDLYRDGNSIDSGATSPYSDIGLSAGTTYQYTLKAIKDGSVSQESDIKSITVGNLPTAPTSLTVNQNGANMQLTWSGETDATGYVVQGAQKDSTMVTVSDCTVSDCLVAPSVINAQMGDILVFQVKSTNDVGESEYTESSAFQTMVTPSEFAIQQKADKLHITWKKVTGGADDEYNLQYNDDGSSWEDTGLATSCVDDVCQITTDPTISTFAPEGPTSTGDFRLQAKNGSNYSSFTDEISKDLMTKPEGLVVSQTEERLLISWNRDLIADENAYVVRYDGVIKALSVECTEPPESICKTGGLVSEFTSDSTLGNFQVEAHNGIDYSLPSNEATTTLLTAPDKPSVVQTDGSNQIEIKWGASSGSDIVYSVIRDDGASEVLYENITDTSFTDTQELVDGDTYTYIIEASNGVTSLSSPASSAVGFVDYGVDAPRNLTAVLNGVDVDLEWTESQSVGIDGYLVYRDDSTITDVSGMDPINVADPDNIVRGDLITGTTYTDENVPFGENWYYVVQGVNVTSLNPLEYILTPISNNADIQKLPLTPAIRSTMVSWNNTSKKPNITIGWLAVALQDGVSYSYEAYNSASEINNTSDPSGIAVPSTESSYTFNPPAVLDGNKNYFSMRRLQDGVYSPYAVNTSFELLAPPTISAVTPALYKNTITWNAVTGANNYVLEYKADSGSFVAAADNITATTYEHTTQGLTGETFTYRVRAEKTTDPKNYSIYSDEESGTPDTFNGIKGYVYYDYDGNEVYDDTVNDEAIVGAVVSLYKSDGVFVSSTDSNTSGYYEFNPLVAGDYKIAVDPRKLDDNGDPLTTEENNLYTKKDKQFTDVSFSAGILETDIGIFSMNLDRQGVWPDVVIQGTDLGILLEGMLDAVTYPFTNLNYKDQVNGEDLGLLLDFFQFPNW